MKNIIVDANNILHRSVGSTNAYLENNPRAVLKLDQEGNDVTAINKFFQDLYFLTSDYLQPDTEIYLVWDRKLDPNGKNWRKEINPHYKSNRKDKDECEQKQKVYLYCKHIKHICDAYGFTSIFPLGIEADDIINYLKNNLDGDKLIISADQDFYQCIDDTCSVYSPNKRALITVDNWDDFCIVSRDNFVLWKSIKGDPSDNIKGLYRYGDVRSKKLVEDWDNLSKKLDEDQMESIEEAKLLIDLNARPLEDGEVFFILKQINTKKEKKSDRELTNILDKYKIDYPIRERWDEFFTLKEFSYE